MPFKDNMKKGDPPLQVPLLRFTTRSALALDLFFNLHKNNPACKPWLEKFASMVQNLTSVDQVHLMSSGIFEGHGDRPNISMDRNELGTCVGRSMLHDGSIALPRGAVGVQHRHSFARCMGVGLGIHLARCPSGHGVLAGRQFQGGARVVDESVPLLDNLAGLGCHERPACKRTVAPSVGVRNARVWQQRAMRVP